MKLIRFINYLALVLIVGASSSYARMTIVNGASFNPNAPMAPGSFVTMFGQHLCSQTAAADWTAPGQLPTTVGGCSVTVNGMPTMMHYVSPDQVNFIVPENLSPGMATVIMHNGSRMIDGSMMIGPSGPGVFAMNGMGMGRGAMLHGTMWQSGPFSATTNGEPTPVSIYMTGLDLSAEPTVEIGGLPVEVTWHGNAPGFAGLQQINIMLPADLAGVGMVPVTVTSNGQTGNVTYMNILPTTEMMQGMPGWGPGMMVGENMRRGREMSYMAFNSANNTALVTDEVDDALRVISLDSLTTVETMTLPDNSEAHAIAVNADGTLAAVALSWNASVALVNLAQTDDITVIGVGNYPSHLAFSGTNLLVTNAASGTVSVVDTGTGAITQTVQVGFGPAGIAADENVAVVANMQEGSLSIINMADFSVTNVALPLGTRPHEVGIASALRKAVITTPMSNGFLILDLNTNEVTEVETSIWNAMGSGAVAIHNNLAFIANQMTASVTVADLNTNTVTNTFPVDPGPRALAVNAAANQLLVLSHGTGVLSIVDLTSFNIVSRANATDGDRDGNWVLPFITSISPNSAKAGLGPFTLTITGYSLQEVEEIEFHLMGTGSGMGFGGGMGGGTTGGSMGGGMAGGGMGSGMTGGGMGGGTTGGGMGGGMTGGSGMTGDTPAEGSWMGGSGGGMGGGMMGDGQPGSGPMESDMMNHDPTIKVTNFQANAEGTRITATVEVLPDAAPGIRRVGLVTDRGEIMGGPMVNSFFTVTE